MIKDKEISRIPLPSNKNFGLTFSVIFLLFATFFMINLNQFISLIFLGLSFLFVVSAFFLPKILYYPNLGWFYFGLLLGKVVSPIVLGIVFFIMITPVSIVSRLFGRDALFLKKVDKVSYWIDRVPPGPSRETFNRQF